MLCNLHVKNLALIEEAEVDFGPGLNILTGETGAGKSILLGSIQLILGGKISRSMIRANAPYALVELVFQVEDSTVLKALSEMDIEPEDGQVVFSRKITEGKSINRINSQTCTLTRMKEAAAVLLDLHGQHEHQSLLSQDKQLQILDAFGKESIEPLLAKVRDAYAGYRSICARLKTMETDDETRRREKAFLEYELQELIQADLKEGEDEELESAFRKMSMSGRLLTSLNQIRDLTVQQASELVGEACRHLQNIAGLDDGAASLLTFLTQIESLLADFSLDLDAYMETLTYDEAAFAQIGSRLDLINSLKNRYGNTLADIQGALHERQEKLYELEHYEEKLSELQAERQQSRHSLDEASAALSAARKACAASLEKKILRGLDDLGFLEVSFAIRFSQKKAYTDHGYDDVEYMISTNPGSPMGPLGEIVSGGELSRIMLAIKSILASKDHIETLIFDEIDTGISGRTAQMVSEKMAMIGAHHQVLCITHLPQIAAMADTHFEIEKSTDGVSTVTRIHALDTQAQIRELGRLLSGTAVTEAVLENAAEMKNLAKKKKAEFVD